MFTPCPAYLPVRPVYQTSLFFGFFGGNDFASCGCLSAIVLSIILCVVV